MDNIGIALVFFRNLARRLTIMATTARSHPDVYGRRGAPTRRCGFCLETTPVSVALVQALYK